MDCGSDATHQARCLKCTIWRRITGPDRESHIRQELYSNCKSIDHPVLSALLPGGWKSNTDPNLRNHVNQSNHTQSSTRSQPIHQLKPHTQFLSTHPYFLAKALPYVYKPYSANKLSPVGNGFWLLIALGMEEPARTMEARRASSTPYDCRCWMR